ncbi:patatin-like phospholipase domain-containing protein 2 [Centropristis striata]|uniref:patatin-like phospholipase domain-containing protein 2 n=1 Tax=Centropristis striata TaxID=184440 RepID=UPI0027E19F29|nr:patatin-like phospholipase domain-containing protein 2 [Centropristis striata]
MHQLNPEADWEFTGVMGDDSSGKMFDWDQDWNISFAGCGFRSIYYLGAVSCILDRVPQLLHGASKICGASSGCLVAAALTVGIPLDQVCADLLSVARAARSHSLGVFHPTFSLLQTVQDSLLQKLPADAHLRASGRLCVSLTRICDGANVLVEEFSSREELIQVLTCSCFFPVYCGFIPPSYRGVLYMDGALSNNVPLFEQRNTITVAPFSGESDICPSEGTFNVLDVHYGNMSVQVNTGNVHRVCTSFLPPSLEKLAEICHNGYVDALRFLRERDLLGAQRPPFSLKAETDACCEPLEEMTEAEELKRTVVTRLTCHQEDQWWLSLEELPAAINRVLCEACRQRPSRASLWSQVSEFLPVKVLMFLLTLVLLPVSLSLSLITSVILSVLMSAADLCRKTRSSRDQEPSSSSSSSTSDLQFQTGRDRNIQPLTSTITTNPIKAPQWDNNGNLDVFSLSSTSTGPSGLHTLVTAAQGKASLNHRSKRTLNYP